LPDKRRRSGAEVKEAAAQRLNLIVAAKIKATLNRSSEFRVGSVMSSAEQFGSLAALLTGTTLSLVVLLIYAFVRFA
jgi:hypothetical protein